MECGGKRSATPLWLPRLVLTYDTNKPKRRRASLAAALVIAVTDTFNHAQGTGRNALEADVCYTRKVVNSLAEKDGES